MPTTPAPTAFDHWADHRNWVQDLADHGYWCVNIGKMHFSPRDVPGGFHERVIVENPTNMTHAMGGADDDWGRYLTFHGQTRPNDRNSTDPDWMSKHQGVPWHLEERFHSDVFIGDSAVSWIDNYQGDKPLFLQVGLYRSARAVGSAAAPPGRCTKTRRCRRAICRRVNWTRSRHSIRPIWSFTPTRATSLRSICAGPPRREIAEMKRHYFAKITTVDEQVGRVLDSLEARGWLENSLLIFCSDHGEMLGDHGLAYKWLMYDPIVHIPLIIRHPGSVAAPSEVNDLVSLMDLGPTILEAAGVDMPTYLEGRSLLPYLDDEPIEPREFVFCEDNYQIMMRSEDPQAGLLHRPGSGRTLRSGGDPHELRQSVERSESRGAED